jgi:serine/threonine protein kinase
MYKKILHSPLIFGDEISPLARSILTGLLNRDPSQRLGVNGAEEIRRYPFFAQNIDFQRLLQKKIQPPFKPSVSSPVDVSNFDTVFTAEEPTDSVVEGGQLSQTVQAQFAGSWFLFRFRCFVVLTLSGIRIFLRWHEHASEPVRPKPQKPSPTLPPAFRKRTSGEPTLSMCFPRTKKDKYSQSNLSNFSFFLLRMGP